MSIEALTTQITSLRPLNDRERLQRILCVVEEREWAMYCKVPISVNFFFDGTNNNLARDQRDDSHSNVAVLFNACREDPADGCYRYYIPGVGTRFDNVGEPGELPAGRSQGTGGDTRINWALIQLINAIHRRGHDQNLLMSEPDATRMATSAPMHRNLASGPNLEGKVQAMKPLIERLKKSLLNDSGRRRSPEVVVVRVGVFGFSRGAAEARAFCSFLNLLLAPDQTLAGIKVEVQFLGLFDTVASVGIADASTHIPFHGFGGWANGTLDVPTPLVKRCVHYVAAHEIRRAFPLSSIRIHKDYPANCTEVVYPGAHSDVGGSYAPGNQGKAVGERSRLLSQIPLVNMYIEALKAGVALHTLRELDQQGAAGRSTLADLQIHPDTARLFEAYVKEIKVADTVESQVKAHLQTYWHWRYDVTRRKRPARPDTPATSSVATLKCYQVASEQQRIDLRESDGDFIVDMAAIRRSDPAHLDFPGVKSRGVPLKEVDEFFDTLVHDSHAGFYMVGPVTRLDRRRVIDALKAKCETDRQNETFWNQRQAALHPNGPRMPYVSSLLSPLEVRVHDFKGSDPDDLPPFTDRDTEALLAWSDPITWGAVNLVAGRTRREDGGHIRYRAIYDTCAGGSGAMKRLPEAQEDAPTLML